MDNCVNWGELALKLSLTGVFIGSVLYAILFSFFPTIKTLRNSNGINILTLLIVGFTFTTFGAGSLINEYNPVSKKCDRYTIQEMGESGGKSKAYFVFIKTGNKMERLSFGKSFNENHVNGDVIDLCLIEGILGFRFFKINN